MRKIFRLVLLFILINALPTFVLAGTVDIVGLIHQSNGNNFNGTIKFQLPYAGAVDTNCPGTCMVSPTVTTATVVNGLLPPGTKLTRNGDITPSNTFFKAYLYDSYGNNLSVSNFYIPAGGTTFDIGAALQTTITTQNIGYINPADLAGNNVWTGNNFFIKINNTVFADQVVGSDASCKIASAILQLPIAGGVVDAINLDDVGGLGACTIDPGSRSVMLLLGPYTYHITQVIQRTNLRIIGMGNGAGLAGSKPPTLFQAMGNNSTPPFVISPTAGEGQEGMMFSNFRLSCTVGNTSQNGFTSVTPATGGLWYSKMEDVFIDSCMGESVVLSGPNGGGINQFSTFRHVVVFRPSGSGAALHIKGFNNSLKFENCQFDGPQIGIGGDGLTNILIEDFTGGTFPSYNIKFDLLTTQWAGTAIVIVAGDAISFDQLHAEGDWNVLTVGPGNSFGPLGISIHDSGIYTSGVHAGNGSIINNVAATANASVQIDKTHIYTVPDTVMKGNKASIAVGIGVSVGPEGSYVYLPPQSGAPDGFGAGAAGTAVTTTLKGGGTGPTTPQTVVRYQQVTIGGVIYWYPLVQ